MLLIGVLHSLTPEVPAIGYATTLVAVILLGVITGFVRGIVEGEH